VAKFSASDIADFVLHSFLAVPVAMSVGFLPEALLSQIYHHTPLEPFSPVIAATAVGLAILSSRWIGSGAAKWVWILPFLWFLFNLWDLARSWSPAWDSSSSKWTYAVKELVTPQCGSTECLYELLATIPLTAAIAYSLTYLFLRKSSITRKFRWSDIEKPSINS